MGQSARAAARVLATTPAARIDAALEAMARELLAAQDDILAANAKDVAAAQANGQTAALVDRLTLD
ncbi:MAG: gamma-glutamyl-phosphate reductase, partial [Oleiharenicola lentus]